MNKTFPEAINGIRSAVMASEVREDIAQGMEYVERFANTATTKAAEAADSAKTAADAAGNVSTTISAAIDPTLSVSGKAADAAKVGEAVNAEAERAKGVEGQIKEDINDNVTNIQSALSYTNIEIPFSQHGFVQNSMDIIDSEEWDISSPIFVESNKVYYFYNLNYETVSAITRSDSLGTRYESLQMGLNGVRTATFKPLYNMYIVLCYKNAVTPTLKCCNDFINGCESIIKTTDSSNMIDESMLTTGYLNNNSLVTNSTMWFTTDFIPVNVGDKCFFSTNTDGTRTPVSLYFLNKYRINKDFISAVTDPGSVYTVEPGVHYIRFSFNTNSVEPMLNIASKIGLTYQKFHAKYLLPDNKRYANYTWLLVGDSLTEKNFRATESYYDFINYRTGINLLNKGHSGLGYLKDHYFYNAVSEVASDEFDFCTMFGSGNDISYETIQGWESKTWQEALGTVTDVHWQSICGAMNMTFNRFYELHPLKKLAVITPTPWAQYAGENGTINGTKMDDYANCLVTICKNRGIPCLDLYHASGLRPWDETFRTTYYNELGVQDSGVHPNSFGHRWISEMFQKFIEQYLLLD